MSELERSLSERAISWLLSHVKVAKLMRGLYLWVLEQAIRRLEQELARVRAECDGSSQVKVTVQAPRPAQGPTDEQMWTGVK